MVGEDKYWNIKWLSSKDKESFLKRGAENLTKHFTQRGHIKGQWRYKNMSILIYDLMNTYWGFQDGASGKDLTCKCRK